MLDNCVSTERHNFLVVFVVSILRPTRIQKDFHETSKTPKVERPIWSVQKNGGNGGRTTRFKICSHASGGIGTAPTWKTVEDDRLFPEGSEQSDGF
jgi:hypothetical protein